MSTAGRIDGGGTSAQQTFIVDPGGEGDYKTIQEAVDAAGDGDTIVVMDGVYDENVKVDKAVAIVAANLHGADMTGIELDGDGIAVEGFNIRATRPTESATGVLMSGADNEFVNAGEVEVVGEKYAEGIFASGENGTIGIADGGRLTASASETDPLDPLSAVGIMVSGEGTWSIEQEGRLEATATDADSEAMGIMAYGDPAGANFDVTILGGGDIDVRGGQGATGIALWDGRLTLDYSGNVTVTADGYAGGVVFSGDDGSAVVLNGSIAVDGGDFVTGVRLGLAGSSKATINGPVNVTARNSASSAKGVGIEADDRAVATVAGDVSVEGGEEVWGVQAFFGADSKLLIEGAVAAVARGIAATATGIAVEGRLNGETIFVGGAVTVEAASGSATGVRLKRTSGTSSPGEHVVVNLAGDISVTGADSTAVAVVEAHAVELANTGTIVSRREGGGAVGLDLRGVSETVKITNDGVIDAGSDGVAIDLKTSKAAVDLVLAETADVVGDIHLGKEGEKHVTVYAGARLDGALSVDARADSTLVLQAQDGGSARTTRLQQVEGFDDATVKAGHWIFEGPADISSVDIEGGRVSVDGTLNGSVRLGGGVLGGGGTIAGDVDNTDGTVAPGNSFGVLVVDDYTQGRNGELQIEIGASSAPEPGVDYDQLRVTGTAVFEDGTTVRIVPRPGVYTSGDRYVIVQGSATFDPDKVRVVFGERGRLFLDGQLEQGSMELVLETEPFEDAAATGNQAAVARVLSAVKDKPDTDLDELYSWLFGLEPGEEEAARAAYDSLSGEVYTALPTVAVRRLESVAGSVRRGSEWSAGDGRNFWAAIHGNVGRIHGDAAQGSAGSAFRLTGLTAGANLLERGYVRAGVLAGFLNESLSMDARRSSLQGTGVHVGAYGSWETELVRLTGVMGVSKTRNDARRQVVSGVDEKTARGAFESTDTVMSLQARFGRMGTGSVRWRPLVSVGYYTTRRNGFRETGADHLGLTVQAYDAAWTRGRVGVEFVPVELDGSGVRWDGRLMWVYDFSVAERQARARFNGASGESFEVSGTKVQPGGFEVSLGLSGESREGLSWSLDYAGEFREDGDSHVLQGRVGVRF